jgi:hypothetical protein
LVFFCFKGKKAEFIEHCIINQQGHPKTKINLLY